MSQSRSTSQWVWLVLLGLVAGFLSGMFGVGGGILIVPALILLIKMDPKIATGTSLLAILPVAVVGVVTYSIGGHIDVWIALLMAIGSIGGSQIGTRLLRRISRTALQWAFIGFIVVVIVSLFLVISSRDAVVDIHLWSGAALVLLGFVTGILSGLLGIGGGVIIVPMLVLLFGASDLVAKGSSLLMMIVTSMSGTISNARNRNVDFPAAIVIGIGACLTTAFGAIVAAAIPPFEANVAFAVFLVLIAARMIATVVSERRKRGLDGDAGAAPAGDTPAR